MVEAQKWAGSTFEVIQWRDGAEVYAGEVIVYDNAFGVYGRRQLGPAGRQWSVGDIISLRSMTPRKKGAAGQEDICFDFEVSAEESIFEAIKNVYSTCNPSEHAFPGPDDIMMTDRNGEKIDSSVQLSQEKFPVRVQVLVKRIGKAQQKEKRGEGGGEEDSEEDELLADRRWWNDNDNRHTAIQEWI